MAGGDKGPKPVADILVREWRRGRLLQNVLLLGFGMLIGFYGAVLFHVRYVGRYVCIHFDVEKNVLSGYL